jgi:YegS/Rv2252/BmrU family lipid kinase
MKQKEKVFVVVNPEAGGGTGHRLWPQVSEDLRKKIGPFDFEESTAIGHAQYLAADAANAGYSLVAAFGGDGTVHEVANGIMEAEPEKRPTLGILCVGTGGDFIKTLGIPKNLADQIRILAGTRTRRIDLGRARYLNASGETESRFFINIASAGISAEVVRRTPRFRSLLGKRPAYLAATLDSYLHWSPKKVTIATEHGTMANWPEKPMTVVVANGRYFGGGMPIAPRADPSDGYFDLVVVGKIPAYKVPLVLTLLYSKQLHRLENVHHDRVRRVHLASEGRVDLDIDGEPIGSLPASFEILPSALEVKSEAVKSEGVKSA